ncbi:hypothetical protein BCM0079_0527 [Bacillus cereus]|nr:hypothetical protein BCM0045_0527 [Bacillus cereus]BCB98441.1 hypothetical protein BCM0057_0524 [Bacillus cereus]BCC21934.1 hypothetical protein BCM0079_0527 [Bacillus cereus]BCC33545.1 hypothetical protein BCM0105_0535 [Bacillus cereus]
MKKKMMMVFTIGVMSLSILGGASPSETSKGKTDYKQRSKEQLNNGKIHAVHTEEKAEKLGIETHAHQLKNFHYPQVTKNVILSKKLARKGDIFYESFDSR